jgi:hypothetical protein
MKAKEIYLTIVEEVVKDTYTYHEQIFEISLWVEQEFEKITLPKKGSCKITNGAFSWSM